MDILFIKPGSLGDVVHALPTAAALRAADPDARLTWVVDPRWSPILEGSGVADELLEFPREQFRGLGGKFRALAWYRALGTRRPDLAIDLQGLLRSALIAKASRAKNIIGLSDAREGAHHFYDQTADTTPATHAVDRYLQILPTLGIPIPATKAFPLPATIHNSPFTIH
ncbi:MAG: glycosyltransferase family 9 protein, partial [Chthoniobacterales bacterium]